MSIASQTFIPPRGWKQAFYYYSRTAKARMTRRSRIGEVLPGISTKGPLLQALPAMLGQVYSVVGEQEALNASYMLCITGRVPRPMGVPHLSEGNQNPTPLVLFALKLVRELARVVYKNRVSGVGFSLPNKSSVGFPYMVGRSEGLAIRRAYVENYVMHLHEIADLLEKADWNGLMNGGERERFYPMFPVTTVSWRLQPDKAVGLRYANGVIQTVEFKQRHIHDQSYTPCVMDTHIADSQLCRTMRSRPVCAVSSTVNMLYQANIVGVRELLMQYPIWHITSVAESHRRACNIFKSGTTNTYDFSQMDHSMESHVWRAYLDGFKSGGASNALQNLASAIRYSPFLVSEDDYAQVPPRPVRLMGNPSRPDDPTYDLGNRSGEADTDVFNKITGTCAHLACAVYSGMMAGITPDTPADTIIERFLHSWALCACEPGDQCLFEGNCGDDHAIRFIDENAAKKYARNLSLFAPYWDVTCEEDHQLLGWRLAQDGTAVPFLGRAISNYLCPERFWTDPMRRDFFMLGVTARDEHYSLNPEWVDFYRPLMVKTTADYCGVNIFDVSRVAAPSLIAQPMNAAELELLYNPDAIVYKYSLKDIRPEFLKSLNLHYPVSPEMTFKLQL